MVAAVLIFYGGLGNDTYIVDNSMILSDAYDDITYRYCQSSLTWQLDGDSGDYEKKH